jgi:ComF family protein
MRPLAGPLSRLLYRAIPVDAPFDVVTPVPLHWRRWWSRGYNQSALLASRIASRRGIPAFSTLRRVKNTGPQTGLTGAQRRKNLSGAVTLRATARRRIEGRRILLVDDVMTTGATGHACAWVLKRGGARSVTLLTLARTDRRLDAPAPFVGSSALGV